MKIYHKLLFVLLSIFASAFFFGLNNHNFSVFAANPSANLDQCANLGTVCDNSHPAQWQNGNLGQSQAQYFEGDSVPYRMVFDNLSIGPHTVTIQWDTTKSGKHAIDYLTSFDRTVTTADPCAGITGCGSRTNFAIPADPNVTGGGVTPISGNFSMYNGTITSVSAYSLTGLYSGDSSTSIKISFNASNASPVLAWGGHIARRADWGLNNAAIDIPGSPYHTSLVDLDGSGGSQDRSLAASAVIFPGSITIIKQATPEGSTAFPFTASPSPLSNFSLVDDGTSANTKVFSNITNFQSYTINETPIPSGWGFDSVSCSVTSPNGGTQTASGPSVTINMNEGENWTCTYNNSIRTGTLIVKKHVVNDNGGTLTASNFTLHVKSGSIDVTGSPASGSESGTSYTLNGGTYTVSENTPPSGYTQTGFSGDCNSSGVVTVVAGQTKTCTITNNDVQPKLTVTKVVVNDNGGTKSVADFPLYVGATQVTSGTQNGFNAGTYTVSETQQTGYTQTSITGDCAANGSVTLNPGDVKSCTITNNDIPPSLTLVKQVVNDNGGTALPSAWTLTATGPTGIGDTGPTVTSGSTFSAGTYTLSESGGPSGYTADSWNCVGGTQNSNQITLGVGQSATCTIINNDIAPQLTVIKHVVNDDGGSNVAADFTMNVTGTNVSSPSFAGSETGTTVTLNVGSYSVGETGPAGYSESDSADCSGTIALGQTKSCTITNDDIAPQLTVIKHVVNNYGGTAVASNFTMQVTGTNVSSPSFPGNESGVTVTLNAGSYGVGETGVSGYIGSSSSDCSGSIAVGQTKTCTITNNDIQPTLTVIKQTSYSHGGTLLPSDFTLHVTNNSTDVTGSPQAGSVTGTVYHLNAGTYNVYEDTPPAGYFLSNRLGDCVNAGNVTLQVGDNKTCTLVNSDIAPTLTVNKVVINDNGGSLTGDDFPLFVNTTTVTNGDSNSFDAGSFVVSETQQTGYAQQSITGDCDSNGHVTLAVGDDKTCTITNNDIPAHLIVVKHVINDNGGTATASDFTMNIGDVTVNGGSNSFAGVESPGVDSTLTSVGTYTVTESGPSGYQESDSADCSGTIALGQTKTCTITNDDIAPQLTVIKHVVNNYGGTAVASNFTMNVTGTNVSTSTFPGAESPGTTVTLNQGTYSADEDPFIGYTKSLSSDCSGTINVGETKTCTITNSDIQPLLTVTKVVVNDDGGTLTSSDFPLFVNTTGVTSGTQNGFNAGTYTVSETQQTGYTQTSITGDCAINGSVTLSSGDVKFCTITNDDQPAHLIVIKHVINDNGGTAVASNFTMTINGITATGGNSFPGQESPGTDKVVTPGTYNVIESGPGGYASTFSADCNSAIALGQTKTCTVTNNDLAPTRTLGYWSTHLTASNYYWMQLVGAGQQINCSIPPFNVNSGGLTSNRMMGGFWSSVSQKTNGSKRTALGQAKMQLAQQLIAAMLNKKAFNSDPGGTLLPVSISAFCTSLNKTTVISLAGQLGIFNQSGDSVPFPSSFSNIAAESTAAQSSAYKTFWDNSPVN